MKKGSGTSRRKFIKKKKLGYIFDDKEVNVDYKSPQTLSNFLTERGKILPRTMTGISRKQQSEVVQAVKRARYLAFLPFSIHHFENE